jgi:hypothetical protein
MKGNVLVIIFADLSCLINEHNHLSIFVSAATEKYLCAQDGTKVREKYMDKQMV